RLERLGLALESEAELEDPPLTLRQLRHRLPDGLALERLGGLLRRILRRRIAEQVAELAVVGRADGLVQRGGGLCDRERFCHVANGKTRGLGELLVRRLAAEPRPQLVRRTRELHAPLVDVDGHADRRRLVRDRALTRLAN